MIRVRTYTTVRSSSVGPVVGVAAVEHPATRVGSVKVDCHIVPGARTISVSFLLRGTDAGAVELGGVAVQVRTSGGKADALARLSHEVVPSGEGRTRKRPGNARAIHDSARRASPPDSP